MIARAAALASRGTKHTCTNSECGHRFYDLNKLPTPCPYCGIIFTEPAKVIAFTPGSRPSNYRVYKLQQEETPPDEPMALVDVPAINAADEDTGDTLVDDVLEIEEEDDETLRPDLGERGEA